MLSMSSEEFCRKAAAEWLSDIFEEGPAIAGTVTFRRWLNGCNVSEIAAKESVRHFHRRISRIIYGGRLKKNTGVRYVAIREGGGDGFLTHLHYHTIIQVPYGWSAEEWSAVCEKEWRALKSAGPYGVRFKPVYALDGWVDYILKKWSKPAGTDLLDPDLICMGDARNHPPLSKGDSKASLMSRQDALTAIL